MLYTQLIFAICGALLLTSTFAHFNGQSGLSVKTADMWCFRFLYNVGAPNLFERVKECLDDPNSISGRAHCDAAYDKFCGVMGIAGPNQECQTIMDLAIAGKSMLHVKYPIRSTINVQIYFLLNK